MQQQSPAFFVVVFVVLLAVGFAGGFVVGRQGLAPFPAPEEETPQIGGTASLSQKAAPYADPMTSPAFQSAVLVFQGKVGSVEGKTIVLSASDGKELRFRVTEATILSDPASMQQQDAKPGTTPPSLAFEDLAAGDTVTVAATFLPSESSMTATVVTRTAKANR